MNQENRKIGRGSGSLTSVSCFPAFLIPFLLCALCAHGQTNTRVTALPATTTPQTTDVFPLIRQSTGQAYKVTASDFLKGIISNWPAPSTVTPATDSIPLVTSGGTPQKVSVEKLRGVYKVFNVRDYGATGDGVTDDAPAIRAAKAAMATNGSTKKSLYFPTGIYKVSSDEVSGSWPTFPYGGHTSAFNIGDGQITIYGDGPYLTKITTASPRTIFDAYTGTNGALDLVVRDMAIEYTGGYNTSSNAVAIVVASGHPQSVRVDRCEFIDFIVGVYFGTWSEQTPYGEVTNCYFHHTHGKASVAATGGLFPWVSILESAQKMVVRSNRWRGTDSYTYTGLLGSPPANRQVACDGLFNTNASGLDITVENNIIQDNAVEGIYIAYDWDLTGDAPFKTLIQNNTIEGEPYNANNQHEFRPGIRCDRFKGLIVQGNTIINQGIGVFLVGNAHANDVNQTGVPVVYGNPITEVIKGVWVSAVQHGGTIAKNTIRLVTSPPTIIKNDGSATQRNGIYLQNSTDIVLQQNDISGGSGWEKTSGTVSSSTHTVITLTAAHTMTASGYVQLKKATPDGVVRNALVASVTSTTVTLNSGWADSTGLGDAAVNGDTLLFTTGTGLSQAGGIFQQADVSGTVAQGNAIREIERATYSPTLVALRESANTKQTSDYASNVSRTVARSHELRTDATGNPGLTINNDGTTALVVSGTGGNVNTISVPNYSITRITDGNQPANQKIIDQVWDSGAWFLRTLNDNLSQRAILFNAQESGAYFSGNIAAGASGTVSGYAGNFEGPLSATDGSGIGNIDSRKINWYPRAIADANITVTTADSLIVITSATANRLITIPSAASVEGFSCTIKSETSATGTYPFEFSAAIEGSVTGINSSYGKVNIYARAGAWHRL